MIFQAVGKMEKMVSTCFNQQSHLQGHVTRGNFQEKMTSAGCLAVSECGKGTPWGRKESGHHLTIITGRGCNGTPGLNDHIDPLSISNDSNHWLTIPHFIFACFGPKNSQWDQQELRNSLDLSFSFHRFSCFKLLGRSSNQLAAFVIVWRKGWWFWEIWDGNPTWEGSKCRDGTLKTLDLEARWSKYLSCPQVTMSHETMSLRRDLWHFIPVKTTRDGIGTVHVAFADLEEVEKVSHSSRITVNIFASRLPPLLLLWHRTIVMIPWLLPAVVMVHWDMSTTPASRHKQIETSSSHLRFHKIQDLFFKNKWHVYKFSLQFLMNLSFFSGTGNFFSICAQAIWISLLSWEKKHISSPSVQAWLSHRRGPVDFNCEPETWSWENNFPLKII